MRTLGSIAARVVTVIGTVLALLALSAPSAAHDLCPGAVSLREIEPGLFAIRITPPQDGAGVLGELVPELPAACTYEPDGVRCIGPFEGELRMPGLEERRVKIVVHVEWLDGRSFDRILFEGESTVVVPAADTPNVESSTTASAYLWIGVEHIWFGFDHLLFVLGLALVARRLGRVAVAVTGFTIAHSLTLIATSLGYVEPPSTATELIIAGSIVLLAAEATSEAETLTRRVPWLVACIFGLVHGFGFAGALAELGLPEDQTLLALVLFNVGVELGQLAVLAVALAVASLVRSARDVHQTRGRLVLAYAIGLVAGVWTVERAVKWVGELG